MMNQFQKRNQFHMRNRFLQRNRFLLKTIPFAKGIDSFKKCQKWPKNRNRDSFGIGIDTALTSTLCLRKRLERLRVSASGRILRHKIRASFYLKPSPRASTPSTGTGNPRNHSRRREDISLAEFTTYLSKFRKIP